MDVRCYRDEDPNFQMNYLFVVIGISVINGLAMTVSYAELLLTNILILVAVWIFEHVKWKHRVDTKIILYEKIELVKAGREKELMADLKERTGLDIVNVEVGHINFLKDIAYLRVHYKPERNELENTVNHLTKVKSDNYF